MLWKAARGLKRLNNFERRVTFLIWKKNQDFLFPLLLADMWTAAEIYLVYIYAELQRPQFNLDS